VPRAVAWAVARAVDGRGRRGLGDAGLGDAGLGDAALATRPWRRALAEASRSGWRADRDGGRRHGRSAKLQQAHAGDGRRRGRWHGRWRGRWTGGGDAALATRLADAPWRRGLGDARSLKLRGPGGAGIGMAAVGMVGARSFSKRMRGTGGAAGGGDAALATRLADAGLGDAPCRRTLATRAR
jgi:hypothetical protein